MGKGNAITGWQLACQRLNLNDQFWGENPGTTRAGALVQSSQPFFEEALSPHADDFATRVQASGDLIIGQAIGGEKYHSRAYDLEIR